MQRFMPGAQPQGAHSFNPGALRRLWLWNSIRSMPRTMERRIKLDPLLMPPWWICPMPPPFSSSISPATHPNHASSSQSWKNHISINSSLSHMTSSKNQTTSSVRKRKRDATADMPPPSSKRGLKNRTENLNPVIISSQLNLTLTRL